MGKPKIGKIFKSATRVLSKHSPEILTGLGIAGMATTVVLAVKATPKALELIEIEKQRQNDILRKEAETQGFDVYNQISNLKPFDAFKVAWKCYAPAVISGALSIGCIIGGHTVSTRRTTALATAYSLSEAALKDYTDKTLETVGEETEKVIRDKVAEKQIKSVPAGSKEIISADTSMVRCYDAHTGRQFYSNRGQIEKAVNDLNRMVISDMYASLNDFYDFLDLKHSDMGELLGWKVDDGQIDICFSSQLDEAGLPCLVINYNVAPKYDFDKLY